MNIDLASGITFIESFMVDTCVITRDSKGILDDILNMSTGVLERPSGDTVTVYSGKCNFRTKLPRARPWEVFAGEGQHEFKLIEVLIPISADDIELGDIVTCTSSVNDPRLTTRAMRVQDVADGSLKTYRSLHLEEITYTAQPED